MVNTIDLTTYTEQILNHGAIKDASQNGVQVGGALIDAPVLKVCSAVDSGISVLREAAKRGAQVLLVHHGLLWGRSLPVAGLYGEKVRFCMENGLTLFASHLPLDSHPEFGNSAQLARHFNLTEVRPSFMHGTAPIGVIADAPAATRESFMTRGAQLPGGYSPRMLPFGPTTIRRVGIVSGGTSSLFEMPEVTDLDLLITGEPRQSNFHDAAERKVNLLFIGHYSSETVGVRAVGDHLAAKFGVTHEFIDVPTGI
jgi:dinuclear metal center YbgI/SA1388 family protein